MNSFECLKPFFKQVAELFEKNPLFSIKHRPNLAI